MEAHVGQAPPTSTSATKAHPEIAMPWTSYLALFFGGAFAANSWPHLAAGMLGKPLQTPFASPPFRGMSPPHVNVLWALVNLAVAYWLLVRVTPLDLRSTREAGIAFAGFGAWALACSRSFARLREVDRR